MHTAGSAAERVTIAWDTPHDWSMVQSILAALLHACDDGLAQHTADWLGHCKALVEADGAAAYGSITGAGEPLSWRGSLPMPLRAATITLYAVVYAVPDAAVAVVVRDALATHLPAALPK
jgi:hypothetical protein